jgi:hypothetical protein
MSKAADRAAAGWGGARPQRGADPKSRVAQQEARARKEREASREADASKRARLRQLRHARDESERAAAEAATPVAVRRPRAAKA